MKYYFEDQERDMELKRILDEWVGTPFKHHCGVKKLGCDCVHFSIKVFEELGLITLRKGMVPDYPRDWHLHNTREPLYEAILKHLNVDLIEMNSNTLMNGDIILSHYGKASSHVGIYYDEHVYQALDRIGVRRIHFDDQKFKKQMKFVFRIIK